MLDSEFYGLLAMKVMSAQLTAEEWHHAISSRNCNFPLFSLILISGLGLACMLCTPKQNQRRGILLLFFMLPGTRPSHSACWIQHILTYTGIYEIYAHFCLIYLCLLDAQRSSGVRTQSEEFRNLAKLNTAYTLP